MKKRRPPSFEYHFKREDTITTPGADPHKIDPDTSTYAQLKDAFEGVRRVHGDLYPGSLAERKFRMIREIISSLEHQAIPIRKVEAIVNLLKFGSPKKN